jgi:hypothetical protein
VVDVADRTRPREVGRLDLPPGDRPRPVNGPATGGIAAAAGRVLIALGARGLLVVDASDPTNPRAVLQRVAVGQVSDVAISGDNLAMATGGGGLAVARYPAAVWRSFLPFIGESRA